MSFRDCAACVCMYVYVWSSSDSVCPACSALCMADPAAPFSLPPQLAALQKVMAKFGVVELARTGRVALKRGDALLAQSAMVAEGSSSSSSGGSGIEGSRWGVTCGLICGLGCMVLTDVCMGGYGCGCFVCGCVCKWLWGGGGRWQMVRALSQCAIRAMEHTAHWGKVSSRLHVEVSTPGRRAFL